MSAPRLDLDAPTVLCVLGMHRSGTSLLAGSLQAHGIELGEVNTQAPNNHKGNRENLRFRDLNMAILKRHGLDWKTPPDLPTLPLEWTDEEKEEGRACLDELCSGEASIFAFKDPRTIWTYEGWRDLAPTMRTIGVFRHPGAVIQSLTKRQGPLAIERAAAIELWRRTNRRLLALIRLNRFPLLHFDADDLGTNFFRPLHRALDQLGLPVGAEEFYDSALVNNADATLRDAGAASTYSELLREMGWDWSQ